MIFIVICGCDVRHTLDLAVMSVTQNTEHHFPTIYMHPACRSDIWLVPMLHIDVKNAPVFESTQTRVMVSGNFQVV